MHRVEALFGTLQRFIYIYFLSGCISELLVYSLAQKFWARTHQDSTLLFIQLFIYIYNGFHGYKHHLAWIFILVR